MVRHHSKKKEGKVPRKIQNGGRSIVCQKRVKRGVSTLIAGIFDVHIPEHDEKLFRLFLEWCVDNAPGEVIIGGDFLELGSCSQHGGVADPASLASEIEAGNAALDALRKANPKAKITYLEGNHETRLNRTVVANLPTWHGIVSVPALLHLRDRGISWHPYGSVVERGRLGFTHGYWCSQHHAAKHLLEYGCSIAYGHTHKPQIYTRGRANGGVSGAFGMPCMRTLDVEWMDGKPTGWMQGFGAFYIHDDGCFTPYMVLANRGRFVWGGKMYESPLYG